MNRNIMSYTKHAELAAFDKVRYILPFTQTVALQLKQFNVYHYDLHFLKPVHVVNSSIFISLYGA